MRRRVIEGPVYETEGRVEILAYGPLHIELHPERFPRLLHPEEALSGVGGPKGDRLQEVDPIGTRTIEVVATSNHLYHPTDEPDGIEDVVNHNEATLPPQVIIGDEWRIEIRDQPRSTTLSELTDDDYHHHLADEDRLFVTLNGNTVQSTVLPRDEVDEWIASGRAEMLVPLSIRERAYNQP